MPTARNSAAVCLSTLAAHVRLTSVIIAVMASVSPTGSHLQGNSPAGKITHTFTKHRQTHTHAKLCTCAWSQCYSAILFYVLTAAQMEEPNPAVTHVIQTNTVQMASAP